MIMASGEEVCVCVCVCVWLICHPLSLSFCSWNLFRSQAAEDPSVSMAAHSVAREEEQEVRRVWRVWRVWRRGREERLWVSERRGVFHLNAF